MSDNQVPEVPTSRDAKFYYMNHPKRGIAMIFNHVNYKQDIPPRHGSDVDCAALAECLRELKFDVKIYRDLNSNDIQQNLKIVSEMDHTDSDCLFIAVLTHGDLGELSAYDKGYSQDMIFSPFTGNKCKTLAGKPKIFVIQACQGEKVDEGITLRSRLVTDGVPTFKIPNQADFLIAYATPPGYLAYRHVEKGSWFILALCTELRDHGKQYDLATVFTFVCNRVALQYATEDSEQNKQIPCITSRLTRLIQF